MRDCRHCSHCRQPRLSKSRNLCSTCYYTPEVREQYPVTTKHGRRGPGNFYAQTPAPLLPTTAAPGTNAKQSVFEERAGLNQSLFHPYDARYEGDPLPLEFVSGAAASAA